MTAIQNSHLAYSDQRSSNLSKSVLGAIMKPMIKVIRAYVRHRRYQEDYALLVRMKDRDLADMGITRNQLRNLGAADHSSFGR